MSHTFKLDLFTVLPINQLDLFRYRLSERSPCQYKINSGSDKELVFINKNLNTLRKLTDISYVVYGVLFFLRRREEEEQRRREEEERERLRQEEERRRREEEERLRREEEERRQVEEERFRIEQQK